MSRVLATAIILLAFASTSCGTHAGPAPADGAAVSTTDGTGSTTDGTAPAVDPDQDLVASGMLMQKSADAPVELCVGGVADSYPPQCGGPVLQGEFSWDDVTAESANGVRWTNDAYYGVGRLDLSTGGQGTFTLSRPLSAEPPAGFEPSSPEETEFRQLCEDPTVDVPDVDQAARTDGPEGMEQEQELLQVAQQLEGYVTIYLSDGGPTMNLIINAEGDLDEARSRARAVFTGPLCVMQRDLPSSSDLLAAQEALHQDNADLHLLSSGAGGTSGLLEVGVLVADQQTIEGVHRAVERWLTPDQVDIWSTFQPLQSPKGR